MAWYCALVCIYLCIFVSVMEIMEVITSAALRYTIVTRCYERALMQM